MTIAKGFGSRFQAGSAVILTVWPIVGPETTADPVWR
jgi:hypothetical protein